VAELRVAARFCGPPGFANGGVASGSLAVLVGGAAEVVAAATTVWITVPRHTVVAGGAAS
jgi:hypothetical protein